MLGNILNSRIEDALRAAKPEGDCSHTIKHGQHSAVCKRALVFFPDIDRREPEPVDTCGLRFHHLLISLEGAERTGCLKISAKRSRSAVLLYRGRVVGAVYGRRQMTGQYLNEDAHRFAMNDLAFPGNLLDAYELPEDLVLAAASLFYGETLDCDSNISPEICLEQTIGSLLRSGLPGTLVVNSLEKETIAVFYVAKGRLAGVFSAEDGWMQHSVSEVKQLLPAGEYRIHASILPVREDDLPGFSLTGLGEKGHSKNASLNSEIYKSFSAAEKNSSVERASLPKRVLRSNAGHRAQIAGRETVRA